MTATQPAADRQDNDRQRARALARIDSPVACAGLVLADAPGVRQLAEQLRTSAPLPPELTAALFGFAIGLICGFALSSPTRKD